ncbi:Flp pilus assembly protein TadG [Pseudomonas citronellolis]|uniref:Flp pilus assembly protein TadG n=1 Tax=Pseudomonas citronellolis TaxID=53408 RepID=A0AAQ1KIB1_9PSED|nr:MULTISPECIES: TadE/TadG family type IV pilus assembly protein [Pseudomonas]MCL6688957.1 pilus assembly protein [Pseudomonas sp. R3.Fl]MCP1605788.1 Flp pilus assembly protein TadG [Pseudomonas citronellolis]MCP1656057.1 Flp pilus assembly protein TadG [Pseudomonas citronellolis]MCP1722217.1 Flp pilus assembly protein TadG [Pseudomonas citronellolis]TGC22855.1 pilus assembly protein [Pseudomonas citronellolis]
MQQKHPSRQRGAVTIEFAAAFILFFTVMYGVLAYGIPMLVLQSFNDAAAAGARVALSVNDSLGSQQYQAALQDTVAQAVSSRLGWMPSRWYTGCSDGKYVAAPVAEGRYTRITVCVRYPADATPLVPVLTLPGIGPVPRLPAVLQAQASLLL